MRINDIIETVKEFAQATRDAFKIDVMVVDQTKKIIVATGALKPKLNKKIVTSGVINNEIFINGKPHIIVTDSIRESVCVNCERYQSTCDYKNVVAAGIYSNNELQGVISLNVMTEEEEVILKNNEDNILKFLTRIASLLSSKLIETQLLAEREKTIGLLNAIYNKISTGVIVVDENNNIVRTNEFMRKILGLKEDNLCGVNIFKLFPELYAQVTTGTDIDSYTETIFNIGNKCREFIYSSEKILVAPNKYESVYFFEDATTLAKLMQSYLASNDNINLQDIIGKDKTIIQFKESVLRVAATNSTVLLFGETGSGKELFARAIHANSSRSKEPFVAINCGAIPETLIESELFGYEKGAFTGASDKGKHGKFYIANGGTLFLDEVEAMPLYLQQKLLRVLEVREIEKIGSSKPIKIDIRIISATNIKLEELVTRKEFREDLYYRLNVVALDIPPLRERGQDIMVLTKFFIERFNKRFDKKIRGISKEVEKLFTEYHWPGNIRELQNAVEYAINMETDHFISMKNLPYSLTNVKTDKNTARQSSATMTLAEVERSCIEQAIQLYGKSEKGLLVAAEKLGISRATIYRKVALYKL